MHSKIDLLTPKVYFSTLMHLFVILIAINTLVWMPSDQLHSSPWTVAVHGRNLSNNTRNLILRNTLSYILKGNGSVLIFNKNQPVEPQKSAIEIFHNYIRDPDNEKKT